MGALIAVCNCGTAVMVKASNAVNGVRPGARGQNQRMLLLYELRQCTAVLRFEEESANVRNLRLVFSIKQTCWIRDAIGEVRIGFGFFRGSAYAYPRPVLFPQKPYFSRSRSTKRSRKRRPKRRLAAGQGTSCGKCHCRPSSSESMKKYVVPQWKRWTCWQS